MYSSQDTKNLQKETTAFLKKTDGKAIQAKEIEDLRNILRFHEHRYYILNDPLISDFEYDQLYKSLEKIEAENQKLITPDSPTQRVAKGLTKAFPTVQHLVPMLSLDNSYNSEDLVDFDRKAREATKTDKIEYCVEPKFDGGSISLIYEDDMLVRGATRGNGVEGDEVTTNIRQIKSIPLSAKFSGYGLQQVEIRGEVLINKTNFAKYNHEFEVKRDDLPYEIDGMVIKVNDVDMQDKLGMTSHHPRWAIAYKFKARQGTSKLLNVEFQVGRTGSITPVAKIQPVHIGGVTVSSISLFNEDVIREKDLRIGDTVLVERAGDVIPYIVKPLDELRTGNERPIVFPKQCPICHDTLFKPEDEAVWRCININCEAQV